MTYSHLTFPPPIALSVQFLPCVLVLLQAAELKKLVEQKKASEEAKAAKIAAETKAKIAEQAKAKVLHSSTD